MFIAHNKVRMHDTDMAGILYFARQFRFAHDALEDLFEAEGISFDKLFHDHKYAFVVVHAEADYFKTLRVGDRLEVRVAIERVGESSVTFLYEIYRPATDECVGKVKTVHVAVESKNRKKCRIPDEFREIFAKYVP